MNQADHRLIGHSGVEEGGELAVHAVLGDHQGVIGRLGAGLIALGHRGAAVLVSIVGTAGQDTHAHGKSKKQRKQFLCVFHVSDILLFHI